MIYVVNVSGGLTSFEALRRTIERYGQANTRAVFADTLIEDADLYRFLDDQERLFGIKIERLADGRTPWQVMKDRRVITIGSMAPCSQELKRAIIDRHIDPWRHELELPITRVFGMSWDEFDRMERLTSMLAPEPVWFPLAEPPFVDKCHIAAYLERFGIKPPRLYNLGFSHNNCGGGCVKAGQAHWAHLWRTLPEQYALWEAKEEEIRTYLGKDVSILKDRRGGETKPLTLRAFREQIERGERYDKTEWGGCGCFAPVQQERMDALLLEADIRRA
jgi:3'-phosphoadenosine 5'-phosphosulfate sulfotransferase (PAPS reductase)/FAD synthetase